MVPKSSGKLLQLLTDRTVKIMPQMSVQVIRKMLRPQLAWGA